MNPETLKLMKELAEAVGSTEPEGWLTSEELANRFGHRVGSFIANCSPANVSALIAEYERLKEENERLKQKDAQSAIPPQTCYDKPWWG